MFAFQLEIPKQWLPLEQQWTIGPQKRVSALKKEEMNNLMSASKEMKTGKGNFNQRCLAKTFKTLNFKYLRKAFPWRRHCLSI